MDARPVTKKRKQPHLPGYDEGSKPRHILRKIGQIATLCSVLQSALFIILKTLLFCSSLSFQSWACIDLSGIQYWVVCLSNHVSWQVASAFTN